VWLGVIHSEPTPTAVTSRHLPMARTRTRFTPPCGARDDSKMIKVRQRQDRNTPQRLASPQTAPSNKVDPAPSEAYHLGWPRTPELGDLRAPTRAARTAVSRTDSALYVPASDGAPLPRSHWVARHPSPRLGAGTGSRSTDLRFPPGR